MNQLEQKIKDKTAHVAVIGLGYVGLPLSLAVQDAGFFVWGIDTDKSKIAKLKAKRSYIDDVADEQIANAIKAKRFIPTYHFNVLQEADIAIIAVPTPLDKYHVPDLAFITNAVKEIAKRFHKNELIILESTTYPGTTEEVVLPILQKSNPTLAAGRDFFLAFSPERVDPGNKQFTTKTTPKVVGGVTKACTKIATYFYSRVIDKPVPVSSAKTAEMTKLLENIFRIVNISMVNELTLLCGKMGIDIWEVIEAASTKPYGFMPFYPGPGIGGHCIAVDPFYLSYKAREYGFFTRFIDLAGEINELMPHYVVTKVSTALNYSLKKSINGAKILLLGVSYKKNIRDTRESAAYTIAQILHQKGARLWYYDPYILKFQIPNPKFQTNPKFPARHALQCEAGRHIPRIKALTQKMIRDFDAILILTDHQNCDYTTIVRLSKVVIDTRNAIKNRQFENVYHI